jgi:hypothetical protein
LVVQALLAVVVSIGFVRVHHRRRSPVTTGATAGTGVTEVTELAG